MDCAAAPRLRMTRLSPSRTSTVLRSLAAISLTICSRSRTSIGLSDAGGPPPPPPPAEPPASAPPPLRRCFRFSLNVAALEGPVEVGQHLAAGVGDQHVVLDAYAAFAGEVDARFHRNDHPRPQLLLAAGLAHRRHFVDVAADAVTEPVAEEGAEAGALDDVAGDPVGLHGGHPRPQELDRR